MGRPFFRIFWFLFGWGVFRLIVFLRRQGPHLPKGPVLLVPNHCSLMDPVVVQTTTWRHISYMMTTEFYDLPAFRWFFKAWGAIPVREGRGNRGALSAASEALRAGRTVAIYPEGGIARDGRIKRFHPGLAAIAEAARVPVVPVAIVGTFEAYPRHAARPKLFKKVIVRYGAPIPPPDLDGDDTTRRAKLRAYTERVREAVIEMLEPRQRPLPSPALTA